jgi:4-amino-4-deoxy-L-arabinose transferase-like glycosyltransferase
MGQVSDLPSTAERAPSRAERYLPPALFGVALVLLAWILVRSLSSAVKDERSDDGYYLHYMTMVRQHGLSVFPALFEQWNTTKEFWIFPPPSRIGFIVTSALWSHLFGTTIATLQYLSLAAHLVLCVVNYAFARKHLGEPKALLLGLSLAFSPLLMGISRLALTDSFNALCMTTTVWLFVELSKDPGRFALGIPFMLALAFTVLTKELSVFLCVPFLAFVAYERFVRKEPRNVRRFALWFAIPGVLVLASFLLAAGGAARLLETMRIVLSSPATNDYAIKYGEGPWFRTVLDFLLFSPGPTLLAIAGLGLALVRFREGVYERTSALLAFLAVLFVLELSFFTKNIRYAVVLELPLRFFAIGFVVQIAGGLRTRRSVMLSSIAVLILCWLDWRTFDAMWVKARLYDPVTAWLAFLRHLVPMTKAK